MPAVRDHPVKGLPISVGAADFGEVLFRIDEYNIVPAFLLVNKFLADQ